MCSSDLQAVFCTPQNQRGQLERFDLRLLACKALRKSVVLPALTRSRAKCIQFMFNTFEPERLGEAVGAGRCAFGMPFVQATLDENGRLSAVIGAGGQKSLMDQPRWVEVFAAAGLPAALEPDMPLWLRCHAPLCVAFESVSVAGVRRGGGAAWREAMVIARGVRESFTLIQRLGFRIYPQGKSRLSRSPVWVVAALLWVMSRLPAFRDLLATGIAECRALVDAMLAAAPRAHPAVAAGLIAAMKPAERS